MPNKQTLKITLTYIIFFLWLLPLFSFSQQVSNIHFEQINKQIHIYYDLQGEGSYNVKVYCSEDGGITWGNALVSVTGAIGENQRLGTNKVITWDVLSDREKLSGDISFKIKAIYFSGNSGYFTDNRDGKKYNWVRIGDQIWMAENLNYSTVDSWCYDNDYTNCNTYGRLYNWNAALKACPNGWHLPSDNEWKIMEMALGMSQNEAEDVGYRGTDQGKQLKSSSGWYEAGNGKNSSGFTAFPGGNSDSTGSFDGLAGYGHWWLSTEASGTYVWYRGLGYDHGQVGRGNDYKTYGFSVRCLRD